MQCEANGDDEGEDKMLAKVAFVSPDIDACESAKESAAEVEEVQNDFGNADIAVGACFGFVPAKVDECGDAAGDEPIEIGGEWGGVNKCAPDNGREGDSA